MSHLLEVAGLSRNFGGLRAVNELSFEVAAGEILGIIGPNGAGKSTAVNLISGVTRPKSGRVRFADEDVTGLRPHVLVRRGLARTFQATAIYGNRTVRENCRRGAFLHLYAGFLPVLLGSARAQAMRRETESRVDEVLRMARPRSGRRCDGVQFALRRAENARYGDRSGGLAAPADARRAGGRAERGGGQSCARRHSQVRERGIALVVIDHNMRFMADLCDRIVVMHHGQVLARGKPQEVLTNADVIHAYLGRNYARAQA